jgi:enamidase
VADLVIRNAGAVVSGDLAAPLAPADTVVVRDGHIAAVGTADEVDSGGIDKIVDAGGMTLAPGLIDTHTHPVFGDFTPRQTALGFMDGCVHGGVTTMISAGEVHTPGRPRDPDGVVALAVAAHKAFAGLRPAGMKVLAGALLLEPGLTEEHVAHAARAGVSLVGEIGVSGVHDPGMAAEMTRWAHGHGMRVMIHTGGSSIPGSGVIGADFVLAVQPDIASHLNGGPTAPPRSDVEKIAAGTTAALEVVQCGNVRALINVIEVAASQGCLGRVVVGTDMPSGTGVIPLGMLRTLSWIAALTDVSAAQAVCMATGNSAERLGLNRGRIRPGSEADLVLLDAPKGSVAATALEALSAGDTPAVAAVVIDGEVRLAGSRNTPPPKREAVVPGARPTGH